MLVWATSVSKLNQECLSGTFLSQVTSISGHKLVYCPAPIPRSFEQVQKRSYTDFTTLSGLLFLFRDTKKSKDGTTRTYGYPFSYITTLLTLCLGCCVIIQCLLTTIFTYILGKDILTQIPVKTSANELFSGRALEVIASGNCLESGSKPGRSPASSKQD